MNHLAHLLLSERHPGVVVGNFIADELKGRQWQQVHQDIGHGVLLHRFIDEHADTHEINADLRTLIRPYFGKYAGVALDIYMDHFLARNWKVYAPFSIDEFLEECDQAFEEFRDEMPAHGYSRWKLFFENRWMHHYGDVDGIGRVFNGMRRRIPYETGFEHALKALKEKGPELESGFNDYFPLLRLASRARLLKLASY